MITVIDYYIQHLECKTGISLTDVAEFIRTKTDLTTDEGEIALEVCARISRLAQR